MTADFSPRRVVSLQPSATDTLARLGLLDRVVACTRYCAAVCPGADAGRLVIADSWSAQADEILAAHPDLVIASVPYRAEAVAQILKAGVRFLALAPRRLADVYGDIAAIAGIMGAPERGQHLIAEMRGEIAAVSGAAAGATRVRVFCEQWGKPIMPSEPWVAELIEAAGGVFIGGPGRQIEASAVAAEAPEVIIFAWTGAGDRVPMEQVLTERSWLTTPAARNGRCYVIRDELLNTPGPTLIKGLRALACAIHPDRFPVISGVRQIGSPVI